MPWSSNVDQNLDASTQFQVITVHITRETINKCSHLGTVSAAFASDSYPRNGMKVVQIQESLVDRSGLGSEMLYNSHFIRNHCVPLSYSGKHLVSGVILHQRFWATRKWSLQIRHRGVGSMH